MPRTNITGLFQSRRGTGRLNGRSGSGRVIGLWLNCVIIP